MRAGGPPFPAALWLCLAVACSPSPGATTPAPARIAPDAGGPIVEWILFLGDGEQSVFLPTAAALVRAAHPSTRFRIVHSSDATRQGLEWRLEREGALDPGRLDWFRAEREVPWWVRDQFLLGRTAAGEDVFYLHHPDHYEGINASVYGQARATEETVRRLAGDRSRDTRTRIEGGVIVADEERAFVNARWLRYAEGARDFPDAETFRRYLDDLYGRPVEVLPAPFGEPGPHCDVFLAPVGRRRVILGDPERGADLVEATTREEREAFFEAARAVLENSAGRENLAELRRLPLFETLVAQSRRNEVVAAFRAVERRLVALGYEVIRVPWAHVGYERGRQAFVTTYTNVVLEDRDGERLVYLPELSLPGLDEEARRVWAGAGFRVVPVPALGPAIYGGGVRCLSHVLRAPSPPDR